LTKRQVSKRRRIEIPIREGVAQLEDAPVAGLGRPRKLFVDEADTGAHDALQEPEQSGARVVQYLSLKMQKQLCCGAESADGLKDAACEGAN
jgi:hypothetical protein